MNNEIKNDIDATEEVVLEASFPPGFPKEAQTIDGALELVAKKNPSDVGKVAQIVSQYLVTDKDKTDKSKGLQLALFALGHSKNIAGKTKKNIEDYMKHIKVEKFLPANQEKLVFDKNTDKETLKTLVKFGASDEIKRLALAHPNTEESVIEEIAKSTEGGPTGISMDAKALRDVAAENTKQSRDPEIYNWDSKRDYQGKNRAMLDAIERRMAQNTETPAILLKKIAKSANKDIAKIAKDTIKGIENKNPYEQADDVSAYGAELSLNRMIGRLHDVAMQAIQNKHKGVLSKIATALGKGSAEVTNTGIIPQSNGQSIFKGVTNKETFYIEFRATGIFGREKGLADVVADYMKYFSGSDLGIGAKDKTQVKIDKIKDLLIQKKDARGRKLNVYQYPYTITYKIYKSGASTVSGLTESINMVRKEDNIWLKENKNPFNHNEKIISENHSEKLVKLIDEGHNLEAKNELKELLKEKIKAKFAETLKTQK